MARRCKESARGQVGSLMREWFQHHEGKRRGEEQRMTASFFLWLEPLAHIPPQLGSGSEWIPRREQGPSWNLGEWGGELRQRREKAKRLADGWQATFGRQGSMVCVHAAPQPAAEAFAAKSGISAAALSQHLRRTPYVYAGKSWTSARGCRVATSHLSKEYVYFWQGHQRCINAAEAVSATQPCLLARQRVGEGHARVVG